MSRRYHIPTIFGSTGEAEIKVSVDTKLSTFETLQSFWWHTFRNTSMLQGQRVRNVLIYCLLAILKWRENTHFDLQQAWWEKLQPATYDMYRIYGLH